MRSKNMRLLAMLLMLLMLACAGCGGNANNANKESKDSRAVAADDDEKEGTVAAGADGEESTAASNGNGKENTAVTMRLEKSEGTVEVADDQGKAQEPREKLPLFSGYGINTQSASFSWFNLDDTKLAKMDENSAASIEKEGKKLKLLVDSGRLYFNVTEPLEEDETLEIRTSSMVVGIRGTCGWVDADTNTVYLLRGVVTCSSADMEEEAVELTAMMCAYCEDDGSIWPESFDPMQIPEFVWDEMDIEIFEELGLSPNREDLFAEPEERNESEQTTEGNVPKDTEYGSGTTRVVGVTETEHHEFVYVDGVMSSAEYDDFEGKGGWGGSNPNEIEKQPYYGLTVEELVERLENQGYTVTIN